MDRATICVVMPHDKELNFYFSQIFKSRKFVESDTNICIYTIEQFLQIFANDELKNIRDNNLYVYDCFLFYLNICINRKMLISNANKNVKGFNIENYIIKYSTDNLKVGMCFKMEITSRRKITYH